jgi:diguanylate cyclase (GGDEF)-like protein/PAS domain S-box-containing protein
LNAQYLTIAACSVLIPLLITTLIYLKLSSRKEIIRLKLALHANQQDAVDMRLSMTAFNHVQAAMFIADKNVRIIRVNPAFTTITGYPAQEAIGQTPRLLASGNHPKEFYEQMWTILASTGNWQGEITNRKKSGATYTEFLSINTVYDDAGEVLYFVAFFSDISARKIEEDYLHNLAHYDVLTGLPNRTLLSDRLLQAISAAKRDKSHMAVMFIDLDQFKPVNDTHGHHIGDLLLKEVAKRILACLRESDSAARIGGDEFIVLLPLIEQISDAVAVAEKIRYSLVQPVEVNGFHLLISASIGVAVYPDHGNDEKSLLNHADAAMYLAKEKGRNNVTLYDRSLLQQQ